MEEIKGRVSTKGQIVIPKALREIYKIYSNQEIIFKRGEKNIIIETIEEDPINILRKTSAEAARRRKGKKLVVDPHSIYEQFEKRERRAGIKI